MSKPIVYSCSGCSSAAQMTNYIALELDKAGDAEMSCIAGVGGNVKPLVSKAEGASAIVALDGCKLACVKNTLAQHDIEADVHVFLSDHGVKKRYKTDFDQSEADAMLGEVRNKINALQ